LNPGVLASIRPNIAISAAVDSFRSRFSIAGSGATRFAARVSSRASIPRISSGLKRTSCSRSGASFLVFPNAPAMADAHATAVGSSIFGRTGFPADPASTSGSVRPEVRASTTFQPRVFVRTPVWPARASWKRSELRHARFRL
jgi:hypothetical protein